MLPMLKWLLLAAVTVGVTLPLSRVGVPSAALFAALGLHWPIVVAIARELGVTTASWRSCSTCASR